MICNTCILFFKLSFLGLGPKLEPEQASQPLAPLCPPNLARKDKEWMKVDPNGSAKLAITLLHVV